MAAKNPKWVWISDEISCTGCNTCVQVCGSASLVLVNNVSMLISLPSSAPPRVSPFPQYAKEAS